MRGRRSISRELLLMADAVKGCNPEAANLLRSASRHAERGASVSFAYNIGRAVEMLKGTAEDGKLVLMIRDVAMSGGL